jgi:hypothetical protein
VKLPLTCSIANSFPRLERVGSMRGELKSIRPGLGLEAENAGPLSVNRRQRSPTNGPASLYGSQSDS